MTTSQQMFLVLSRELNFHRAAERCFVTQQCLSDHIRRLEEQYGTALVFRRPKVALTPAGQALLQVLQREQVLEQDLQRQLQELAQGQRGTIHLGINSSRAQVMVPQILAQFRTSSPSSTVVIHLLDTRQMERELAAGTLDCFIGVDTAPGHGRVMVPLLKEDIYLLIPQAMLPQLAVPITDQAPIPLSAVAGLPFVRNLPGSTLNGKVDTLLEQAGLRLTEMAAVSDYSTQIELCRRGLAAAFCPQMLVEHWGKSHLEEEGLAVFPVAGLQSTLRLDLVYDASRLYPECVHQMLRCIGSIHWSAVWDGKNPLSAVEKSKIFSMEV